MAFEESKHPRDKGGKFTTKGNEGGKEYRQNTSYEEITKTQELEDKYNSEWPGKANKSFVKARKSLSKQIEKHNDKIKNPEKYILDWDNKPEIYKKGIIKYWEKVDVDDHVEEIIKFFEMEDKK